MKITLLQVGKTKEKAYEAIEAEFLKRLGPYATIETITVKTSTIEEENRALQSKIPAKTTVVALDLTGKSMSSEQFAEWILEERDFQGGKITFVIGGPHGLTDEARALAHRTLSLSSMTFTHQMVRLFLLEQIYRAFTILSGKRYHY